MGNAITKFSFSSNKIAMEPELNDSPVLTMGAITKKLFNRQFLSDVQFVVENQVIYAHSLELMKRSVVFQDQLQGNLSEQKSILITDVKYNSFYQFVHFIYCDECVIDNQNMVDLLKLARRYKMIKLLNQIVGSVQGFDMILTMFEHCLLTNDRLLLRQYQLGVLENLAKCLETERFLTIHWNVMEAILKFESVNVSEFQMFVALTRWMTQHAADNKIDISQHRIHYEKLLHLIRFPVMTSEEIITCVSHYPHLFTINDCGLLLKVMTKSNHEPLHWSQNHRSDLEKYDRLLDFPKNTIFKTKFSVTRKMFLIGLECGMETGFADIEITLSQKKFESNFIEHFTMIYSPSPIIRTVCFINVGESFRLQSDMEYVIEFKYCVTGSDAEKMSITCRTTNATVSTNISPDFIKFENISLNLFDLIFKLAD